MNFTGLGGGTQSNPYQITTVAQYKLMLDAIHRTPVFTGSGLNDISYNMSNGPYYSTTPANKNYLITITANKSIVTYGVGFSKGSGYAIGNTFYVSGNGTGGLQATGHITGVDGGGGVTSLVLDTAGEGHSTGTNIGTTKTSGGGDNNLSISVSDISDFYTLSTNGGTASAPAALATQINLADSFIVYFGAKSGHTKNVTWYIEITPSNYYKQMNDLDFSAETTNPLQYFYGNYDGNGYSINNMLIGDMGLALISGCTINNYKVNYTRWKSSHPYTEVFRNVTAGELQNVTLNNIHIISTAPTATGTMGNLSTNPLNANCTVSNIVLEGNVGSVFSGKISCLLQHIKVFRNYAVNYASYIINDLNAELRYAQLVMPNFISTNYAANLSFLVNTMRQGATITESFAITNASVTYADDNNYSAGLAASSIGNSGTHTIQDCYLKGNYSVNRGTFGSIKSGFAISSISGIVAKRCYFSGNLTTPSNTNRTPLVYEFANNAEYCYFNSTKITGMTPTTQAGKQLGLTTSQFNNSSNYTTWNFANTWNMGADAPILRNNPLYTFTLDTRVINIASTTRNSSTQVTIVIADSWGFDTYGLEISLGASIIYDVTNTLSNIVTVDGTVDNNYTVKLYWLDGGVKNYVINQSYFHYCEDSAINVTDQTVTQQVISLSSGIDPNFVHGSCLYGNYVYGSTRNKLFPTQTGSIVKVSLADITSFSVIPIYTDSEGVGNTYGMDQILECGGFLWTICTKDVGGSQTGLYVIKFNPQDDSYKIFKLEITYRTEPIVTDGTYLYITANYTTHKVDPSVFTSASKFNTATNFSYAKTATYTHASQGGYLTDGTTNLDRGLIHSACTDANYLYLSFTTYAGTYMDISGYSVALNKSLHEVHKVLKSDMTPVAWNYIPKSTDDMSQNLTHLFYGIEVQPNANVNTYGYGVGAYAVRKSDLRVTLLPKLHSNETPAGYAGGVTSYGSLIFGNYLLDTKTNNKIYVLDISDVDNWLITEPVGKRTLKCYNLKSGGNPLNGIVNEMLLSENGYFYGFLWTTPTGAIKTQLSGLSFFSVPTIETVGSTVSNSNVVLSGYLLNTGGETITDKGFIYGTSSDNLSYSTQSLSVNSFTASVIGLPAGTYYYSAYASNTLGDSANDIKSFGILTSFPPIFLGTTQIQKVYFNGVEINYVI